MEGNCGMKYQVGELVALLDISDQFKEPTYHLGYIESVRPPGDYFVYFFHMEKTIWYSEHFVDAFKQTLKDMVIK
jgi:hypothetical protein